MAQRESLKEIATRFARQQHDLFGDVVSSRTDRDSDDAEESVSTKKSGKKSESWFETRLSEIEEPWTEAEELDELQGLIDGCQKCDLWKTRLNIVFGTGDPHADVMVIGEAPGADEDRTGKPFVGRAGELLTKILEAVDFSREDVFICNIIKSRPPGNRRPEPEEVAACIPYLYKQIELVKPRFILALGLTAAKALLGTRAPMKELRGNVQEWHGIPVIVTYHPAALLRNPNWKRPTWEDVQTLRRLYDESTQDE